MIVTICIGSSCHLKGSKEIVEILERLVLEHNLADEVELNGSFCLDQCVKGVCVRVEDEIFSLTPATTEKFFRENILGRLRA